MAQSIIWEGQNISKSFGHNRFQLKDISLALKTGEITGVVGENGNGKTTLLRIIAGELDCDQGHLSFQNKIIIPESWRNIKEQISYIPQRIPRWYGYLKTNLEFQASSHGLSAEEVPEKVDLLLSELGLSDYAHLKWSEISTGYRLRFQLAKMLIGHPKLIILDEPIANLDINAQEKFLTDLQRIVSGNDFPTSVILSSQQLHQVEAFSDNIIFLKSGQVEYIGKVNEVGANRANNSFEILGDFTDTQLNALLSGKGKVVSQKGKSFRIETDLSMDGSQFLKQILDAGYQVSYFRDISSSTKKLFN